MVQEAEVVKAATRQEEGGLLPWSRGMPPDVAQMPEYRPSVKAREPLIVTWQGRQVRIRHDDPHLGPYTPRGAVIRSALELASDVEGLRLYLVTALGDRHRVRVADDGSGIGLWRRD